MGTKIIARALRDAGMEVISPGSEKPRLTSARNIVALCPREPDA